MGRLGKVHYRGSYVLRDYCEYGLWLMYYEEEV